MTLDWEEEDEDDRVLISVCARKQSDEKSNKLNECINSILEEFTEIKWG